jgi:hypothetical protein
MRQPDGDSNTDLARRARESLVVTNAGINRLRYGANGQHGAVMISEKWFTDDETATA